MISTELNHGIEYKSRSLKSMFENVIEDIACFLFPPYCVVCSKALPDGKSVICVKCQEGIFSSVKTVLPYCSYCRILYPDYFERCRSCSGRKSPGKLYSIFEVNDEIRKYLHSFKYFGRTEIGEELGEKAYEAYKDAAFIADIDLIIPVPLHYRKRLERGYNQAEILAGQLSARFNKQLVSSVLKRVSNTRSQTYLNSQQRYANVKNAFRVNDKKAVKGKRILLVDDIVTTGATLYECSKVLRVAGALEVISFTAGRPSAVR